MFALTLSYVSSGIFYSWIPVHIREQSKAEPVPVVWRICKAIYKDTSRRSLKCLPNSIIEFIVCYWTPVLWFLIANWSEVWKERTKNEGGKSDAAKNNGIITITATWWIWGMTRWRRDRTVAKHMLCMWSVLSSSVPGISSSKGGR